MRAYDIIAKKRDGIELSDAEISFLIEGYVRGSIPDYQMSAFAMAVYFRGMSARETAELTRVMLFSGDRIDLSGLPGIKVDKHSTGGVGDKTTLVVAPLAAAAGVPVAKMSGRGLGHTGGTLDKLASIPGLSVEIPQDKFIGQVKNVGMAVVGQTGNLVPADKKLYALRDVTATVNSLPLIASSIMSKKLASGADKIILDVKVGSGAFMKSEQEAFALARAMVDIGTNMDRETVALVTDMEQPLGKAVGNAVEVMEAVDTLHGGGPDDVRELSLELAARLLVLAERSKDLEAAREAAAKLLANGAAFTKFEEMVAAQGGDPQALENFDLLPGPKVTLAVNAQSSGVISGLNAETIGLAAMVAGAGRARKEDKIDLAAGIVLAAKCGDRVEKGQLLANVYAGNDQRAAQAAALVKQAYAFGDYQQRPLIRGVVVADGHRAD